MTELIAGKTLLEWQDFARTDRCLDEMVPSDLRQLVGVLLAATTYSTSGAEDRWIEDSENACPYCGGSGHKDDVHSNFAAQLANEAYGQAAERYWEGRWRDEKAENERLQEALRPSSNTKSAYAGEFSIPCKILDGCGNERVVNIDVPWTAIKEIMAAISARAALGQEGDS